MAELQKLSTPQCILLAVQYATESNVPALRALTALREDDFELQLVLRIILTYLPDSTEPAQYAQYLHDLAAGQRLHLDDQHAPFDVAAVKELSQSQARRTARKLPLLSLAHPLYQHETDLDPLTQFLIHRSHRIDAETGLLTLVAQLVPPFLHHSDYLRSWFISAVLPLLRLGYEYYPSNPTPSLEEFTRLRGKRAVDTLLSNLKPARDNAGAGESARDLRGVVGPWTCGETDRKRRKLDAQERRASGVQQQEAEPDDWEYVFEWLAHKSREDLPLVASAIAEWDGPGDIDFGGFDEGHEYLDEARQRRLELRYAQVGLACLYMVDSTSTETLQTARSILARITGLLSRDPPPPLNIGAESLPSYDLDTPFIHDATPAILQDDRILRPENILTQPDSKATHLLELFLFSTRLLASLQYHISIRDVARLYLRNDYSEELSLLQRILHTLSSGPKKDANEWNTIVAKILWLWDWGSKTQDHTDRHAQGILGLVEEKKVHTELLKALLESGHYQLAVSTYIQDSSLQHVLPLHDIEKVVLELALHHYDNATNGNRTRGGMKRASDIVAAFSKHFPASSKFQRMQALLSATHSMSFYSLKLQHGVLFQPVNIRVSADPLSLLRKLLAQNKRSYTHLDDMISIGQNLVVAMPSSILDERSEDSLLNPLAVEKKKAAAERRVIGMAIETALEEDDFETAYSYVVNRLTPPTSPAASPAVSTSSRRYSLGSDYSKEEDGEDIAWRAALMAGRHQTSPASATSTWSNNAARPDLRKLEQRMELLSQALLLAPPSHLEEVLAVWQQCEAEMTTVLAEDAAEEERYNDIADQRLPGAFSNDAITVQPRREVGRGAVEEAPMGLFDVARGAAAAFSKSAFPLRGSNLTASGAESRDTGASSRLSMDHGSDSGSINTADGQDRVRRRDMVANAVTGGLASGIGWVLGAKPVPDPDR
ncbi:Sec39 domain-containing protein [Lophiotrema nucula]|uniref:Sec39 domain-containing protein n=1 Tax=Lophiotrema nucula TaxID=690887 RepID=A0A6A5Z6B6_9PLEO|nr:Sec39 domain-containing protein [Lophiotrema nucula]